jgi:hypothetical protein
VHASPFPILDDETYVRLDILGHVREYVDIRCTCCRSRRHCFCFDTRRGCLV